VTLSVVDFLNARLAETYDCAQQAKAIGGPMSPWWGAEQLKPLMTNADATHVEHHSPERVLREVEAKRRIMERHRRYDGIGSKYTDYCEGCPSGDDSGYPEVELDECPELRDLAAVYSDHPDYREEWRP
jgi:hypothetical protein